MSSLNLDISLLNNFADHNQSQETSEPIKGVELKNLRQPIQDDPSTLLKKTSLKIRALPSSL